MKAEELAFLFSLLTRANLAGNLRKSLALP
jgi:hypothetical protein